MGDLNKLLGDLKAFLGEGWTPEEDYDARYLLGDRGRYFNLNEVSGIMVRNAIREAGLDPYEQIPWRPRLEDFLNAYVPLQEMYPTPPRLKMRNTVWAEPDEPGHDVIYHGAP